jgi:hypothetical protein
MWYDAIQEFALREQAANYSQGEVNALKSAASIRNELGKQIAEIEKQKVKQKNQFATLSEDIKSQLSTRKMSCQVGL